MKVKLKLQLPHKTFSEATDKIGRFKHLIHSVTKHDLRAVR